MEEPKLSENIGRYEAGEYCLTAAIWRAGLDGQYFDTFEIGIRHKKTGAFTLLQSSKWNYQSVQEVANAIAHILSIETECYTPEWFQEYFT